MKFAMSVTRSGLRGLTNAYRSVLSARGSWLMSGASRWLDARSVPIDSAASASTSVKSANCFTTSLLALFHDVGLHRAERAEQLILLVRADLDVVPDRFPHHTAPFAARVRIRSPQ